MKLTLEGLFNQSYILLDGATGSNLIAAGMPSGICVEKWVLEHPDVLSSLQKEFAKSGSNIILAPTFGASSHKLAQYGLADKVSEINRELVAITKSAVGDEVLVAGDLSPSGLFIAPAGDSTFDEVYNIYDEQVSALKQAGVDLIITETQMTLSDLRASVLACNQHNVPVFATITVSENGRTIFGMGIDSAVVILQSLGVKAVGLNCSTGPQKMVPLIESASRVARIPLIAKPNAGDPGCTLSPEEFAAQCVKLYDAGARILGGCCGTTPQHITALHRALDDCEKKDVIPCDQKILVADERRVHILDSDTPLLGDPIDCSEDIMDDFMDFDEDVGDVILVKVNSMEDGDILAENAAFASFPIAIKACSTDILDNVLKLYQGRALVVTENNEKMTEIANKYGAFII